MKHKEIAKAWLNGAEIQWRGPLSEEGSWRDLNHVDSEKYMYSFDDMMEYRIKPNKPEKFQASTYYTYGDRSHHFFVYVHILDGKVINVSLK